VSHSPEPFHLLLYGDGVCRLAFLREAFVVHSGDPHLYSSSLECKNILVGTHVLDGDMAVCTWTKHLEFIPPCLDTYCVNVPDWAPSLEHLLCGQFVGPKEANASARYQRIDLNECIMCDAIDPILSENDLPTSALGLGQFESDEMRMRPLPAAPVEPYNRPPPYDRPYTGSAVVIDSLEARWGS